MPTLVAELRAALPRVIGDLPLVNAWAYKYGGAGEADDARDAGIRVHADNALVNLNLWLTPDEFNDPGPLRPPSAAPSAAAAARGGADKDDDDAQRYRFPGGLTVYGCEPPNAADFGDWNDWTQETRMKAWLADPARPCLARARRVPYRRNRAVVFDSDLLHETAPYRFRGGYAGRRINLTLLFGNRN